jgi:hypothetical protein
MEFFRLKGGIKCKAEITKIIKRLSLLHKFIMFCIRKLNRQPVLLNTVHLETKLMKTTYMIIISPS